MFHSKEWLCFCIELLKGARLLAKQHNSSHKQPKSSSEVLLSCSYPAACMTTPRTKCMVLSKTQLAPKEGLHLGLDPVETMKQSLYYNEAKKAPQRRCCSDGTILHAED